MQIAYGNQAVWVSTQFDRSRATRGSLIAAARELFVDQGFEGTSIEAVVRQAGVTRGAFYHHFKDKTALFAAVVVEVERGLIDRLEASPPPQGDPFVKLAYGIDTFFERCLDPAVGQIVLLEGPRILGWGRWSSIEREFGRALVELPLQEAEQRGLLRPVPYDTLAHVLFGVLVEGAMLMASSADPYETRAELQQVMQVVIDGLRA